MPTPIERIDWRGEEINYQFICSECQRGTCQISLHIGMVLHHPLSATNLIELYRSRSEVELYDMIRFAVVLEHTGAVQGDHEVIIFPLLRFLARNDERRDVSLWRARVNHLLSKLHFTGHTDLQPSIEWLTERLEPMLQRSFDIRCK